MQANRKAILAKIETVYASDARPLTADALVLDRDTKITPLEHDTLDNGMLRPVFGADAVLQVGGWGELELSIPLAGSSDLGVAPAYDAILRACGLSATTTVDECVTYEPVSDSFESATFYAHEHTDMTQIRGCRGSASIEIKAKSKPMLKANLTGLSAGPTAGTLPAVTLQPASVLPVENANSTLTIGEYSAVMESMTIELGNEVNYSNLVGSESVDIVGRASSLKMVIQRPDADVFNMFEARKYSDFMRCHFRQTIDANSGNVIEIFGYNMQITGLSTGELDGKDTLEIDFRLVGGADDELVINFGKTLEVEKS